MNGWAESFLNLVERVGSERKFLPFGPEIFLITRTQKEGKTHFAVEGGREQKKVFVFWIPFGCCFYEETFHFDIWPVRFNFLAKRLKFIAWKHYEKNVHKSKIFLIKHFSLSVSWIFFLSLVWGAPDARESFLCFRKNFLLVENISTRWGFGMAEKVFARFEWKTRRKLFFWVWLVLSTFCSSRSVGAFSEKFSLFGQFLPFNFECF